MSHDNLSLAYAFTKATLHNLGNEDPPSSTGLCISYQHWPLGLFYSFSENIVYLAEEISQIYPSASNPFKLELCIVQS